MPSVGANGIKLFYEVRGDDDGVALLLINGLGSQLTSWDEAFLDALVDRGFRVIIFDNRDVGLSSWMAGGGSDVGTAIVTALAGGEVGAPYLLSDMAGDAAALLDALSIEAAHVVGVSMGGMIAQTLAIEHPTRVRSLTSIMSMSGDADVGAPSPEAVASLLRTPATNRAEAIAAYVETWRVIGTPEAFDEEALGAKGAAAHDRAFNPAGTARQLLAILASGSRAEGLRALDVPTLVIHGSSDPLVDISGGRRTAELVSGATFVEIDGMAHDLPPNSRTRVIDEITRHAAAAAAAV
ncbi:MAG: alpha/beta fold hydrolase [Acidimicrobiales bacterium]